VGHQPNRWQNKEHYDSFKETQREVKKENKEIIGNSPTFYSDSLSGYLWSS